MYSKLGLICAEVCWLNQKKTTHAFEYVVSDSLKACSPISTPYIAGPEQINHIKVDLVIIFDLETREYLFHFSIHES